jgi:hypothetical protein
MLNTSYNPKTTWAEAGNVTELLFNATSVTKTWQGYFGNITGYLTLQDAANNTMYDWSDAEPQGRIYASINSSIGWAYIHCFNFIDDTTINASTENTRVGANSTDVDTINVTFNSVSHPMFHVGTVEIATDSCPNTWTYVNNASQDIDFNEVLLTDGAPADGGGNSLVFMTFIENTDEYNETDPTGFDGRTHDFQMLVAEDGHPGTSEDQLTLYYFWVEIE